MFYRLALDPFTRQRTAYGITFDSPSYRQQRIGYPLLVRLASFGDPRRVPVALFGVNLAALVAMAWTGAALAQKSGVHALWGLTFAFYPGFLLSLARDLSEPVASAFALAALLAVVLARRWTAAMLLTCAALSRETTLLFAIALVVVWLYRSRSSALIFAIPVIVWSVWQMVLTSWWSVAPLRGGAPRWSIPFVEFGRFLGTSLTRETHVQRLYLAEGLFVVAVILIVIVGWRRSTTPVEWRVAWGAYSILALVLQQEVWKEDFGFLRVLGEWFVAGSMIVMASTSRLRAGFAVITFALWMYLAHDLVTFLR